LEAANFVPMMISGGRECSGRGGKSLCLNNNVVFLFFLLHYYFSSSFMPTFGVLSSGTSQITECCTHVDQSKCAFCSCHCVLVFCGSSGGEFCTKPEMIKMKKTSPPIKKNELAPLPKPGMQERQNGFGLILYDPDQRVAALLNLTAAVIWRYLGAGRLIVSIIDAFDLGFAAGSTDRNLIEADVMMTLARFREHGFLSDETPAPARVSKKNQGIVNEYGLPELAATYVRPSLKLYTLEQLQEEFGDKKNLRGPSRFGDTWNPEAG
jgi:hypothetical protein